MYTFAAGVKLLSSPARWQGRCELRRSTRIHIVAVTVVDAVEVVDVDQQHGE
jgi:hypothetical protein